MANELRVEVAPPDLTRSYLEWSPIIGGAVVAVAYSTLMTVFGTAVGLSMTSALPGQSASAWTTVVVGGLWLLWLSVSSFALGGYFAGRLRHRFHDSTESESDVRDGAHGLAVWAVSVLLGAWVAASTAGNVAGFVANKSASAAMTAAQAAVPDFSASVDRLLRAQPNATGTAASNYDPRADVTRILTGVATGKDMAAADSTYLANLVASRTGASASDAQAQVSTAVDEVKATAQQARDAAERARKTGVVVAFMTAAILLLSAAAAAAAAIAGGKHRDENTSLGDSFNW